MKFLMQRPLARVLLILVVGILVYANSFHVPFILDDYLWIETNDVIRNPANFLPGGPGYAASPTRFVGLLSFALNYRFSGLELFGYHLVNLGIHLGCALLVYALLRLTLETPLLTAGKNGLVAPAEAQDPNFAALMPLFAALLFVVHPVQTQAVTYVVQRVTLLATLFYLLSLVLYVRARLLLHAERSGSGLKAGLLLAAAVSAAVLAMASKEIAFTLPLAAALYEASFFTGSWRRRLLYLLPLLLTLPIIPWQVLFGSGVAVGSVDSADRIFAQVGDQLRAQSQLSRGDYLLTQCRVLVSYLRLLICPLGQNLDYDYPLYRTFFTPPVWSSFLLLTVLFGSAWYLFRAAAPGRPSGARLVPPLARLVAFGIFWFFLTLAVESSFVPIADLMVEHRLYLPFFGAAAVFATLFCRLLARTRRGRVRNGLLLFAALLVSGLGVATWQRNQVWGTEVGLWLDVVSKSPAKPRPYNNLGNALNKARRPREAIPYLRQALDMVPHYPEANFNLGRSYLMLEQNTLAIPYLQQAIRVKPDFLKAYNDLAAALNKTGRYAEAARLLEGNMARFEAMPEIHFNLGVSYLYLGQLAKARRQQQLLSRLDPKLAVQFGQLLRQGI